MTSSGTPPMKLSARTIEPIQSTIVSRGVPCAGHEMHATCPLLAQAHEASAKAAEQTISLKALRESFKKQREQSDVLTPQVAQLAAKRPEWRSVTEALTAARRDFQKATELAARKPLLDAAT